MLLRNRNFVLLWSAYAVSSMGDHLSEMAILATQHALDADVKVTAMYARMTFLFFLPFLLFAPIAGWLADQLPRRGLMIFADLSRCAIVFFLAQLIHWMEPWGSWGPFLPLLFVGIFAAVFSPARSALLPTIIHPNQLVRANGLLGGVGIIATMAASIIGGYLAQQKHIELAFRLDAATFVASALLLAFLRPPKAVPHLHETPSERSSLSDLLAGFRYAWIHRHVIELILVAALVWGCAGVVNSVIPAIVRDVYDGTYQSIGVYRALVGAGFIGGALVMVTIGQAARSEVAMEWSLLFGGIGAAVFAASVFLPFEPATLAWIGAVGIIAASLGAAATMASFNALLQRTVADRFRGRVFGVKDVSTVVALLLGTGLLGIPNWRDVDRWVGWILVGVAMLLFAAGVAGMWIRLRRSPLGPGWQLAENLNEFICKFYWRLERLGRPTVPRTGAAIVTSNHVTAGDPMLLCAAAPYRPLSFILAAEYANWPIVGFFVRKLECIPVRRDGADSSGMRQALRHLRAGRAIGVFTEGGIPEPDELRRPRDGVAMMALKTGAPVIPAFISGTKWRREVIPSLLARHRAKVRFGKPVDLSEFGGADATREQIRAASARIFEAIWELAPEEDRLRRERMIQEAAKKSLHEIDHSTEGSSNDEQP
ncbi:MAG: MFS transporter [Phycisphaerae bacterium]|nr:MFS transporter [Phycisphaerae bacterium]